MKNSRVKKSFTTQSIELWNKGTLEPKTFIKNKIQTILLHTIMPLNLSPLQLIHFAQTH